MTTADQDLLSLTAGIVASHISHNDVPAEGLPEVIRAVYDALRNVRTTPLAADRPVPAVPINKSVFPDSIVCLEDGRRFKALKRHLLNFYGMSPEDYRARWDLPDSYPMVAPRYAARRSAIAKENGLGRKRNRPAETETPVQRIPEGVSGKRGKVGRPPKQVTQTAPREVDLTLSSGPANGQNLCKVKRYR